MVASGIGRDRGGWALVFHSLEALASPGSVGPLGDEAGGCSPRQRLVGRSARRGVCLTALVYFLAVATAQAVTFSFTGSEQAYVVPAG